MAGKRPTFNTKERAAPEGCEALPRVAQPAADDSSFHAFTTAFSLQEQVEPALIITTINAWTQIAVEFRSQHPVEGGTPDQ